MKMEPAALAAQLAASGTLLCQQIEGIDDAQLRWKPAVERWSILEVLVHLVEEEHLDFRPRLASTLEDPQRPWPSIDPEAWPQEKRYNERDPVASLADFRQERDASVAWLQDLEAPAWDHIYVHPLGKIRAGDLMVSWLAHDHLHVRQIANLQVLWLKAHAAPYSTRYAAP